jgi:hypothetical protein
MFIYNQKEKSEKSECERQTFLEMKYIRIT